MNSYYTQLRQLLNKSKAPITHRKIACIIICNNKKECYGYNIEHTIKNIEHAEIMALKKIPPTSKIEEIHLMSYGDPVNIKYAIPCEQCCKSLIPHLMPASIALFYFYHKNSSFKLTFRDIVKKYKSEKNILKCEKKKISSFLKKNTVLTNIDSVLLKNFCEIIKKNNTLHKNERIHVFLTGSSTGRSPKSLLAKKITGTAYCDIDLILITNIEAIQKVNGIIKDSYRATLNIIKYPAEKILEKKQPPYKLEVGKRNTHNFLFRKIYWAQGMNLKIVQSNYKKDIVIPSTLDISVGKTLSSSMTKEYFSKKWYMQLV